MFARPSRHCQITVTQNGTECASAEQQTWRLFLSSLVFVGLNGCDGSADGSPSVYEYPKTIKVANESPLVQSFGEDPSSIYLFSGTLFFLGLAKNHVEMYDTSFASQEAIIDGKARLCETFCTVSDSEGDSRKAGCSLSGVKVLDEATKRLFLKGEEKIEHRVLMSTVKVPICTILN